MYSGIPVYLCFDHFFPSDGEGDDGESWLKSRTFRIANMSIVYLVLVFLQFKALRRFSQSLKFGLALHNQDQQRGILVRSVLWILAFFFTVVRCH